MKKWKNSERPGGQVSKRFIFGIAFGLFLAACAATFPYKYYGLQCEICEGTLTRKEPVDDLPLAICRPDNTDKNKCIVMIQAEYERLYADYMDIQGRLEKCEKGR